MDELNFKFKMPDEETLAKYIPIKGEKGEKGDPTKLSQLDNDTGFVTASTDELTNYYTKAQTDSALDSKVDNSDLEAFETEIGVPDGFFTDASETVTGEGQLITLDNTTYAIFKDIRLYGETLQEGAPTPDDPEEVQTVTGTQEIVITDNDEQRQTYTLGLDDIELCRLGNYQDYIYKSDGKWFKHKAVGKYTVDGTEQFVWDSAIPRLYLPTNALTALGIDCVYPSSSSVVATALANKFQVKTFTQVYTNKQGGFAMSTSGRNWQFSALDWDDSAGATADMVGTIVYYALATPTDEEITNTTLIDQLEGLSRAASYNNTTVITIAGSLPATLQVEAFSDNWSGTIAGIDNKTDILNKDVNDALANKIDIDSSYIIDEITVTAYHDDDTDTDYWVTHIPHLDKDGNIIKLKHGTANDVDEYSEVSLETVQSFAKRHNATLAVNATIFGIKEEYPVNYHLPVGPIIVDGETVSNLGKDGYLTQSISILGVKEDNTLAFYPFGTTPAELLADGVVNSFCAFDHIVTDGEITFGPSTSDVQDPWNLIGQNSETKDIYLIECNGRGYYTQKGLPLSDACQILIDKGCDNVYRLDGGGSSTLAYCGVVYNTPTDNNRRSLREVCDFIYFAKEVKTRTEKDISDLYKVVSDLKRSNDELQEKVKYLATIHNSRLTFEAPNLLYPEGEETGLHLRLMKGINDAPYLDSQIVLSPDNARATLGVFDNVNNKTVAKIDGLNQQITLDGDLLATIFSTAKNIQDIDATRSTGVYRAPGNISNIPEQGTGWTIIVLTAVSPGSTTQIAIPQKVNSTDKPWYVRAYNSGNSTWESWKILVQPTAPSQ